MPPHLWIRCLSESAYKTEARRRQQNRSLKISSNNIIKVVKDLYGRVEQYAFATNNAEPPPRIPESMSCLTQ